MKALTLHPTLPPSPVGLPVSLSALTVDTCRSHPVDAAGHCRLMSKIDPGSQCEMKLGRYLDSHGLAQAEVIRED